LRVIDPSLLDWQDRLIDKSVGDVYACMLRVDTTKGQNPLSYTSFPVANP